MLKFASSSRKSLDAPDRCKRPGCSVVGSAESVKGESAPMIPDPAMRVLVARQELSAYNNWAPSAINLCVHEPSPASRLRAAHSRPLLHQAYAYAIQLLASGLDHLGAALILLDNDPIRHFACHTVSRALLEASARSCWLLDLTISERQRLARGLLERVEDIWDRHGFERSHGVEAKQWREHHLNSVLEQAAREKLTVDFHKKGWEKGKPRSIGGEIRPSATRAINTALWQEIGQGAEELGVYQLLSSFAHSGPFALGLDTETIARQDSYELRQSRPNLGLVVDLAVFAAAVHKGAVRKLITVADLQETDGRE